MTRSRDVVIELECLPQSFEKHNYVCERRSMIGYRMKFVVRKTAASARRLGGTRSEIVCYQHLDLASYTTLPFTPFSVTFRFIN